MTEPRREYVVTVEPWEPDHTWTVRWGPGPLEAWYGFVDEGTAIIVSVALRKGIELGRGETTK